MNMASCHWFHTQSNVTKNTWSHVMKHGAIESMHWPPFNTHGIKSIHRAIASDHRVHTHIPVMTSKCHALLYLHIKLKCVFLIKRLMTWDILYAWHIATYYFMTYFCRVHTHVMCHQTMVSMSIHRVMTHHLSLTHTYDAQQLYQCISPLHHLLHCIDNIGYVYGMGHYAILLLYNMYIF